MTEKKVYEVGYLLNPNMSEEEVLGEVAKIKNVLEKQEAVFLSGDEPAFIDLAYPVDKMFGADKQIFEKAFFAWLKFETEAEKIQKIKEGLEALESIIRFLLVKSVAKDSLVSENKKLAKKEVSLTDGEKEKKVEPLKIVKKEKVEISEKENLVDASATVAVEKEIEQTEEKLDPKKEKDDLDETIDNLIIK